MSESITALIAAHVHKKDFKLPVFNPVALEIQHAINEDAELPAIEAMILKDQALATEILRVANSAFFAGLQKQKTVQQALVRLGITRVFSMVMLAAQRQAFRAREPFLNEVMQKLWQHTAASAGTCRWVAIKCGYHDLAESAFLAGLLHDLGSLVVLKVLDEISTSGEMPELTTPVILEVIESLHAEYGFMVMQSWELPQQYAEIARDHHLATADSGNVLIQIVRLVDGACRKIGIGMNHDPELVLEAMPEAQALGIKDVHLAEMEIELEEMLEQFE
ncbi:MAG: HDOD domain-containing protein [Pseudomonadota bacterium]